ncbi:MAG: hypothetical protein ACJAWT_002101, partial [Glaciecola sp.]
DLHSHNNAVSSLLSPVAYKTCRLIKPQPDEKV